MLDVCQTWYDIRITLPAGAVAHMPLCPKCGGDLTRRHRTLLQKIAYSDAFECRKCGARQRVVHRFVRVNARFFFSRYTHCIRCGTPRVHRTAKADRIDSVSNHVVSLMQRLMGAPVNRCIACRLQYYDWRPPPPRVPPK
jgi:uncharacterized Zn finger protein